MAKIQITESDLHNIVVNTIKRIIKESIGKHGTSYGNDCWEPFYDENITEELSYDKLNELVEQGIIPEELSGFFDIKASAECTIVADTYDAPGYCDTEDPTFSGDYNMAKTYIEQIKDEKIRQLFSDSLEMFCDRIKMEDFEEYEPDWDFMPGGHDYYE